VERLLVAYQSGIFPWYSDGEPIIWHAPEERFILELDELHISRSMRRVLNSQKYLVTFDINFSFVIKQCASVARKEQEGTWITNEMIDAYTALHESGYAHSVEVWQEDEIVGGLYGVSLGKIFFAESMFHTASNASKVALIKLAAFLKQNDFHFIDAQVHTAHVESLGAKNIPRNEFMQLLDVGLKSKTSTGKWQ
jgi:leucyl/phenylalanyl-tRNA--protein transferase